MTPPVVYDLSYVAARLGAAAPTGIERVDLALARHCLERPDAVPGAARGLHYGLGAPHRLGAASARRLVAQASAGWEPPAAADPVLAALLRWLRAPPAAFAPAPAVRRPAPERALRRLRWRLADDAAPIPRGAVYLNCAQYAFEAPWFFRWLRRRPDVRPVLFVHDLLPLDHPEFFRAGYEARFEKRVATVARFAHAVIVSSEVVRRRLAAEMARRGRPGLPCLVMPLPPPATPSGLPAKLSAPPYFVTVGTVETRKNHLLLLHAWRQLAEQGGTVPRLVIVGARGWESEQAQDLLDRCRALAPHVAEVSGLGSPALAELIGGARALLMPSFAEGYGLPVAEALAAGTPVIASDLPVFAEVSQGRAALLDPTDGPGWRDAVTAFTSGSTIDRARLEAARYVPPTWAGALDRLDAFLVGLQKSEASPFTSQSP